LSEAEIRIEKRSIGFPMTDDARSRAPQVFDRALIRRRLARALAEGGEDFLSARVAEDLRERLSVVRRDFRRVLDLGTPRPDVAAMLAGTLPEAEITRMAPVPAAGDAGRGREVVGDEERQPFAPGSFDLVVSCLSLHAVNDLPGALVQVRRALKPDGLFLGCLFGGGTLGELRQALSIAESEVAGGASPRVAPFSDLRDLGGLLQRAGFALPVADVEPLTVRYGTLFRLFSDLRAMGATNALTLRHKAPLRRAILMRAAEVYAARFADADGRLRASFDLVWLSGWAPHENQQKPLKPGSARMSLEAALKRDR
jgi:SAM-dependent methyltransferase